MKRALILIPFLCIGMSPLLATPLAEIVEVRASCGSEGGSIRAELTGNPQFSSFYWEHGADSLYLTGLPAGTYTLHVLDFFGCEEVYSAEIVELNKVDVEISKVHIPGKCLFLVDVIPIHFFTAEAIDTIFFTIEWEDDSDAGFQREIQQLSYGYSYNFTIKGLGGDGEICVYILNSVFIPGTTRACGVSIPKPRRDRVIVNEVHGEGNVQVQFIELLVVGDGQCGGVFDLRGHIVDDNNGYLIKPASMIGDANKHLIGIDNGFIIFKLDDNWKEVPNGSLIVIYDDTPGLSRGGIPPDDPEDSNGDAVYILPANHQGFLIRQEGQWDNVKREVKYTVGALDTASWKPLEVSPSADGIQVRTPQGGLSHGISFGQSSYSLPDSLFEVHLESKDPRQGHFMFVGNNPWDPLHFKSQQGAIGMDSPGAPNSVQNDSIITSLKDCSSNLSFRDVGDKPEYDEPERDGTSNTLLAYPSPFLDHISIRLESKQSGLGEAAIYHAGSALVYKRQIVCKAGRNEQQLEGLPNFPSGMYYLRFRFPDGTEKQQKIVRAH
ncbi:hypothetical protein [Phaeodactylibacter luteus]|uniref:T9SS type A sorting domain-containing protein n=1 Tax=Phaeodactylibacter luteus TaxID=1564516 RepID=A0A5C6RHU0_9BACT|nr:hypothetical protein [Phaeodactylibacter luteus]TXB61737.1 hypothetical protein FRY97_17725 [Phaeodactylibacter luteus]